MSGFYTNAQSKYQGHYLPTAYGSKLRLKTVVKFQLFALILFDFGKKTYGSNLIFVIICVLFKK